MNVPAKTINVTRNAPQDESITAASADEITQQAKAQKSRGTKTSIELSPNKLMCKLASITNKQKTTPGYPVIGILIKQ
jgi:hypothetical protein